jgi:hypothetical protein
VFHDTPGKQHRGKFFACRLALRYDLALEPRFDNRIATLRQNSANDAADEDVLVASLGQRAARASA